MEEATRARPRGLAWLRHADPWVWYTEHLPAWMAVVAPVVLLPAPILVALVADPARTSLVWQLLLSTLGGPLPGITLGIVQRFPSWFILATVLWVQLLLLAWLVRNIELLRRWPRLDAFLRRQERAADRAYRRHGWLRKFHFLGLVLFIFLPAFSGIIAGVFLGKLTGMSDRRLVAAVFLGTVLWAVVLLSVGNVIDWLVQRVLERV